MNVCVICNKKIKNDSQFIKGKWYHNDCIKILQEKYPIDYEFLNKLKRIKRNKDETKYFKSNKEYFNFINRNKDKNIKKLIVKYTEKSIKIIYHFI